MKSIRISAVAAGLLFLGLATASAQDNDAGLLEPVSPVDGAIIAGARIEILWPEIPRIGRYHLQIAAAADFENLVVDRTDLAAAAFLTPPLKPGVYWLRSCAVSEYGVEARFCPPRTFQLIALPEAPILSEPKIKGKAVRFTCKNLGPGIVYRFQMARDDRFLNMIEEYLSPKPEIAFVKPSETGIYYARVAAVSPSGSEGPFSDIQTFRIARGGLLRFICLIPAVILLLVLLL
ncbi:MAG: hypothetical protein ACYDH3_07615 [Candidatus Aminicenantales bacterium]